MVAAFPLAKIGLLLLKQLSKPLANFIKNEAKKHPYVRKYVIIPTGNAYRWIELRTISRKSDPEPLTEEESVELGAHAIGEIVLFSLLTAIVMAEYNRQGDKKAIKQKIKDEEFASLVNAVAEVTEDLESLKKTVKKIEANLENALDVFEYEEKRHESVSDNDFLDIFGKKKFKGKVDPDTWDSLNSD